MQTQEEIVRRLKETQALVERFGSENERLAGQIERMRTETRTPADYKGAHISALETCSIAEHDSVNA